MQRAAILPVSVVMPVCNESDIIAEVLDEWIEDVFQFLPESSELLLEDCSTDGTTRILHDYAEQFPFMRVHWHAKDGFFNAAMRAYRAATRPLVFFTDSDGQYVPSEFWKIAASIGQYDMVHGAKQNRRDPKYRLVASRCFNFIARRMTGISGQDMNSAFRLIHRRVLDALLDQIEAMPTLLNAELYLRAKHAGFRVKDVRVKHRSRKYGKSRGLPGGAFLAECVAAYRGLGRLKRDFAAQPRPPHLVFASSSPLADFTDEHSQPNPVAIGGQ